MYITSLTSEKVVKMKTSFTVTATPVKGLTFFFRSYTKTFYFCLLPLILSIYMKIYFCGKGASILWACIKINW